MPSWQKRQPGDNRGGRGNFNRGGVQQQYQQRPQHNPSNQTYGNGNNQPSQDSNSRGGNRVQGGWNQRGNQSYDNNYQQRDDQQNFRGRGRGGYNNRR